MHDFKAHVIFYSIHNIVKEINSSDIIFKNETAFFNMNTRKDYEKIKTVIK